MAIYYLILTGAMLLLSANMLFTKLYQKRSGSGAMAVIAFNALMGVVTGAILFVINGIRNGFGFPVTGFSLLIAALTILFNSAYVFLGFRVMSMGPVSVYMIFLMLGGMTVPYFYGILFLDEPVTPLRIAGMVLMAVAIILAGLKKEEPKAGTSASRRWLFFALCCLIFLLNGMVSTVSKIHQLPANAAKAVPAEAYVMLTACVRAAAFGLIWLVCFLVKKRKRETAAPQGPSEAQENGSPVSSARALGIPTRVMLLFLVLAAATDGTGYMLQLVCASKLPATVQYPFMSGGSVVVSALAALVFLGEKPDKRTAAGIILCFISTLFFL